MRLSNVASNCAGSIRATALSSHKRTVSANSLAHRTPQQRLGLADELVQFARLRLQRLPACECEELRGESLAAPCRDQRSFAEALTARRVLRMAQNHVERADHHREQVVEIVRDAAGQPTQRVQPLRVHQCSFCLGFLRQRRGHALPRLLLRQQLCGDILKRSHRETRCRRRVL